MRDGEGERMDIDYLLVLQEFRNGPGAALADFFTKMTYFGDSTAVPIFLAIVYWCISKSFGSYLMIGWGGNRLINGGLKAAACVYRPWIRDPRVIPYGDSMTTATGYSFPSGHTMNAASVFGGGVVRRDIPRLLRVLLAVVVALVAFSRNFLGVHTPQDVVVGALCGLAIMWVTVGIMRWVDENPTKDWLVAVVYVGIAVVVALYVALKPYPEDLDAEGKLLVDGASMAKDSFRCVGWSVGIMLGWLLERRYVRFSTDIPMMTRMTRLVGGLLSYYAVTLILLNQLEVWVPGSVGIILVSFIQLFYVVFVFPWLLSLFEGKKEHAEA